MLLRNIWTYIVKNGKKSDTYILVGVLWLVVNVDCSAPTVLFTVAKDVALE